MDRQLGEQIEITLLRQIVHWLGLWPEVIEKPSLLRERWENFQISDFLR